MRKLYKVLISAALLLVVALSTVVTSYAAAVVADAIMGDISSDVLKWCLKPVAANEGEDELVAAKNYLDSVWRIESNTTGTVDVTYQTLSDVVAQLNQNGVPCQIKQLRGAGVTGYVVQGTGTTSILNGYGSYSVSSKYFTNTAGAMFRADKDSSGSSSDTSVDLSGVLSALGKIQSKLDSIRTAIYYVRDVASDILVEVNLDARAIYNKIDGIVDSIDTFRNTVANLSVYVSRIANNLDTLQESMDSVEETLVSIQSYSNSILNNLVSVYLKLDDIKEIDSATLTLLKSFLASYQTAFDSITPNVSTLVDKATSIDTTLTNAYNNLQSINQQTEGIFYFLTNENGPIQAIATNVYYIREKLDNLTATCTHDDTNILAALGRIENNFGDINTTLGDLNVTTDFTDTNIVAAINNLASLFSLGETQTIEVGSMAGFTAPKGSAQSISVTCADDTGYVLFSSTGVILPNTSIVYLSDVEILQNVSTGQLGYLVYRPCESFSYSISINMGYSGTLRLFDASGSQIVFEAGDLLRPTATVNHWEVARASGGVVGIDSCTGLQQGLRFEDIFPPCALVPVRDLIASPSLFTSYCYQVGYNRYSFAGCSVLNATGSALTVEYVNPSSLLNWYANRQNDFRYWLDTKLNSLPVSAPADLSTLETKLDSIETTLSSDTYFTPVITSIDAVGLNIEDLNANFNTNIGSLLDKLDIVIEGSSESLENRINVTIDVSNDAHNVFYVTGEDGEEQSVTEFTGDLTKASGRLLSLLYRLVFADALSGVDDDLDGFEDFFTSQGDDTSTQSMDSPYEESENVWLAS